MGTDRNSSCYHWNGTDYIWSINNSKLFEIGRQIAQKRLHSPLVMDLPAGTFLCHKIDMVSKMNLPEIIENVYHVDEYQEVIVANILLDKFQIGTKKSELQKRTDELKI